MFKPPFKYISLNPDALVMREYLIIDANDHTVAPCVREEVRDLFLRAPLLLDALRDMVRASVGEVAISAQREEDIARLAAADYNIDGDHLAGMAPVAPRISVLRQKAELYEWLRESARRTDGITVKLQGDTLSIVHGTIDEDAHAALRAALEQIAAGQVMQGSFSHADTVLAYQKIAREAIAKAGEKA
jgi:hypothetical protein